jgi:hypothetical protein
MRGTFVVTKFNSRLDFEAGRVAGEAESSNRFTNVGLEWMWKQMSGVHRAADGTLLDDLGNARIVVGTGEEPWTAADTRLYGDQTDQAALDSGYPRIEGPLVLDDDSSAFRLVLRSTFGENQAIFDWRERGVLTAQGVLLDRSVLDLGRKVLGAVWQLEARLDLTV